jgi:hypothetical protein
VIPWLRPMLATLARQLPALLALSETSQHGTRPEPGDPLFSDYEAAVALGRAHPKARRVKTHPTFNPPKGDTAVAAEQGAARAIDSAS